VPADPAQLDVLDHPEAAPTPERALSKSKYISGRQCTKLLWHQYNAKDLIPPHDAAQQAIFDQGHDVGRRARDLYPGGVLIEREHWDMDGLLADTALALAGGTPVYEAAFLSRAWLQPRQWPVYAQVDILAPTGDGRWDIIEVKSSTSVKPVYLDDVAVQRFAVEGSGLRVRHCYLAHINRDYVRAGDINNHDLFHIVDITDDVAERMAEVPGTVASLAEVIRQSASPDVSTGPHCTKPYGCPMIPVCWPEGHVPRVVRGAARQAIHTAAVESGTAHVDEPQVRRFLDGLTYPVFFLDFETFGTAIPLLDGTRPYQQIPFQFSLHVRREPGGHLVHRSFLANDHLDPRPQLLQHLHDWLEDASSIVVYFAGFETGRLTELARDFPAYAPWIAQVLTRVVDLHAPFKAFEVYHPSQDGSTSLKAVLPALTGSGYEGMTIADGVTASHTFLRHIFRADHAANDPSDDAARVREDLEAYCRLDTLAMVRILDELYRAAC